MIKFKNFSFTYGGRSAPSLSEVDLEIRDGEFVLISGPSGSGKSTLARCFNGLVPHFYGGRVSGSISVQDIDVLTSETAKMAARVGMVFQDPENQIVSTNVEREIAFGLENLAFPAGLIARRIEESLDTLGIFDLRRRGIQDLSGGEKQKVAIASVLALHPEILVLDEPTSELDPQSSEDVLSIVKRLNEELGITVVLIEHRLERLMSFVDRLIIMDRGRIKIDGPLRSVLNERFAEVTGMGIGVPPVARLAKALEPQFRPNSLPLTVKEGRVYLEKVVEKAGRQPFLPPERKSGQAVIRVEKLSYSYSLGVPAIKNISLEIFRGELVAIMGRNASGKSTLVRHFNGLLKPSRGKVWIDGTDTRQTAVSQFASRVGFVFQNPDDHLFSDTVENEIGFTLRNLGWPGDGIESRINRVLSEFGLDAYRKQYPRSLSGGEKQRVALASVMAAQPAILILDEPTRGMPQGLKDEMMGRLKEYTALGRTVILVSHDVETVAEFADRVILLSDGELVAAGSKYEVLSRALLFSPQINRLAQSFSRRDIAANILTPAELAGVLQ